MKLEEIAIPLVLKNKDINKLNKKPKKLKKGFYGVGFMPFMMGVGNSDGDGGSADGGGGGE